MKSPLLTALLLALSAIAQASQETPKFTANKPLPATYQRIVLLGDSITDGVTYSLLLQQAFSEAGYQ